MSERDNMNPDAAPGEVRGAPLDLAQFGPTLANPDAAALLEECRRQRAEIARLRDCLVESLAEVRRQIRKSRRICLALDNMVQTVGSPAPRLDYSYWNNLTAMEIASIMHAARAALAGSGEGE